nr:hypothetical protein [uncultured bacterium]
MRAAAPVAITGLGAVTALGVGRESLDLALRAGTSGIRGHASGAAPLPVWAPLPETDVFSEAARLGIGEAALERLRRSGHRASPGLRCALVAAAEAWTQAGLDLRRDCKVGLIVAGSNLDNAGAGEAYGRVLAGKQVRPGYAAQFLDTEYVGVISEALSLLGEGYTAGGASASGGVALALGRRAILSGDVSAVLVLGAPMLLSSAELSALSAMGALYRGEAGAIPAQACRPFDESAAGFVYGQGAAALVLEPYDSSQERHTRPLALLRGASMALDGNRSTDPSAGGEVRVMREALAQAGLAPGSIDFVSTHGTSAALGDRTEVAALREVFHSVGANPRLNSTKALTGHCLSAAGVVEAVATVLQLRSGYVHPNPTLKRPIDSSMAWAGATAHQAALRSAMSNSFGFGGINSSQVFTVSEE